MNKKKMRLPKDKYLTKDTELLHKEIEELSSHFGRLAGTAKKNHNKEQMWYYNGVVEGLNKTWKLLYVEDVSTKELKKY